MILVNNPGDAVWPQLTHAAWNGLTVADVVFPAFLTAAGASLALSRPPTAWRVARRAVTLVVLGLVVNRATFSGPWRYPGVLQRIAVCYLIASLVVRLRRRTVVMVTAALLIGYCVILRAGGMTPTHSLGGTIDVALFGRRHMYHGYGYDPEGLLGSVAATASVLIGYLTVGWLRSRERSGRTVAALVGLAAGLAVVGWSLDRVVPVNKRLWTPSFTLVCAGAGVLAVALLYLVIEVARLGMAARLLEVIGANAIAVYVASELGDAGLHRIKTLATPCAPGSCVVTDGHAWLYHHWFASWAGSRPGSLLFSLAFILVLWAAAALLWQAKLFVRV
jgi:predicted acyltransferase